jgi:hypothetical protein
MRLRRAVVVFLAILAGSAQVGGAVTVPYSQDFSATQLPPEWIAVQTSGSVTVKDGRLIATGEPDGVAHAKLPLDQDNITVSVKLEGTPTIYLVWDENNWCGAGKTSPTPFARFYSSDTHDGKMTEVLHRGIGGGPQFIRLQLGGDCVRMSYSYDGKKWAALRTIERTGAYKGAPKWLALGKRYFPGEHPFSSDDGTSTSVPSDKSGGSFTALRIEKTSPQDMKMSADERLYLHKPRTEPVTEMFKATDADLTYDQIVSKYPPFESPRELVGLPEMRLDIGVRWLGEIDVSPWEPPIAHFEVGDPPAAFAQSPKDISRHLQDGYRPVVTLDTIQNGEKRELTVFGWSEDLSPDKDLYAYAMLSLTDSDENSSKAISLVSRSGKRIALQAARGSSKQSEVALRFKFPDADSATPVSVEEFNQKRDAVAEKWKQVLGPACIFNLPDVRVNHAYKAWLAYAMLDADKVDGYLQAHDGSGFYDIMFGQSVSQNAMAMDLYGLKDYTEALHDAQLHFQKPNGEYVQECGLPDHGSLPCSLADHYFLTRDDTWMKRVAPNMIKADEWIIQRRSEAPKSGLTKGLIKFRPYNDYPQPVFNYLGNCLCCLALESSARALELTGDKSSAARFAEEARKYRKDIDASMDRAIFAHGGLKILPIEPDTHRIIQQSNFNGGDYYGLVSGQMLETGYFAPNDRHANMLIDMLENHGGLIAGVCEFMEGIDHAYTYGYLRTMLDRDQPRKAVLGLWSFMAFGMTRETFSPVEVTMIKTGENQLTLPHLYSCTSQLRLLRYMLLREDGDSLVIGSGMPRQWLEPGKTTEVTSAPTTFGEVSFRMEAQKDGSVVVNVTPPARTPANEIQIYFRHPQQKQVGSIKISPELKTESEGEKVTVRGADKPFELRVNFGNEKKDI